jgi:hypothetical protein
VSDAYREQLSMCYQWSPLGSVASFRLRRFMVWSLPPVAPQLTVVSAPVRYEAFQRMRGTPTLLGWGPASRWDMKR